MEPASTSDGKCSCQQGHSLVRHVVPQLDNLSLELFGAQVDFKEVGLNLLIYEILDNIGPKSCQLSVSSSEGGWGGAFAKTVAAEVNFEDNLIQPTSHKTQVQIH